MLDLNSVWDWIGGQRLRITKMPTFPGGLYYLEDADLQRTVRYFEHEIKQYGKLAPVQPGQRWQYLGLYGVAYEIEILEPLKDKHWKTKDLTLGSYHDVHEFTIAYQYTLVAQAAQKLSHGTQTCPRCQSGDAFVSLRWVACVNPTCQWYTTKSVLIP